MVGLGSHLANSESQKTLIVYSVYVLRFAFVYCNFVNYAVCSQTQFKFEFNIATLGFVIFLNSMNSNLLAPFFESFVLVCDIN